MTRSWYEWTCAAGAEKIGGDPGIPLGNIEGTAVIRAKCYKCSKACEFDPEKAIKALPYTAFAGEGSGEKIEYTFACPYCGARVVLSAPKESP